MMYQNLLVRFVFRWLVSSLGLYVARALLGSDRLYIGGGARTILIAGFFIALVNMLIKPLLIFLSLPAILITLGLFMLVINGLTILIADWLYEPLRVKNLGVAILTGMIIGLVNYLVSRIIKDIER